MSGFGAPGAAGGFGAPGAAAGGFGAAKPGGFGAAPAAGGFGAAPAKPAAGGGFGAATPAAGGFGAAPAKPAAGGFGAAPATPAAAGGFGAATPAAGGFGAAAPAKPAAAGGFGAAAPAAGGFGAAPAKPAATGGFGAATPAAGGFGAATPAKPAAAGGFGAAASAKPAAGGFGVPSTPAAGGFGAPAATTATPATAKTLTFGTPGGDAAKPAAAAAAPATSGWGAPAAAAAKPAGTTLSQTVNADKAKGGSGTTAFSAAGTQAAAASADYSSVVRLANKSVGEIVEQWRADVSAHKKKFTRQQRELENWDKSLRECEGKNDALVRKVSLIDQAQKELQQNLDNILGQQHELHLMLEGLEKEVTLLYEREKQHLTDEVDERHAGYKMAEEIDAQLVHMQDKVTKLVEKLNKTHVDQDEDNPVSLIVQTLNAHLTSLQRTDQQTAALQSKINETQTAFHARKLELERLHK